jgi:predicted kinase
MKNMIIMRGLPGSGKSYRAKELYYKFKEKYPYHLYGIFQADAFWYTLSGKYEYDSKLAGYAHDFCRGKVAFAAKRGVNLIIVDNTNITIEEMKPYLTIAAIFGYQVTIEYSGTPWAWDVKECVARNQHAVPEDVIQSMKDKYQPLEIVSLTDWLP